MELTRDLTILSSVIAIAVTAILSLIWEMLHNARAAYYTTIVGLLGATILSFGLFGQDTTVFSGTFRIDSLGTGALIVLLPSTILVAVMVRYELKGREREGTLYPLLCLSTLGSVVLASAGDSMLLVLGLLLSGIASFGLVGFLQTRLATEAVMKYFLYASVTGAVMIFGLTYWYGAAGSTYLTDLNRLDAAPWAGLAGLVGVLIGLGYKAGLLPFHFWVADTYEGAPLATAAYLSVVTKIGALFALAQIMRTLPLPLGGGLIIALIAAATMTYGNLLALRQQNVVRLLGYSSVAQSGYFLLGVLAVPDKLAITSLIYFAAAYAMINIGIFAIILQVGRHIDDYVGLAKRKPATAIALTIFLLSLVGIPPVAGFVGKLFLFSATIQAGFIWLAVVAIINSALGLAVYLRIIAPMFRRDVKGSNQLHSHKRNMTITAVWVIATIGNIVLGIGAQLFLRFIN